jgi:hypothetical protein
MNRLQKTFNMFSKTEICKQLYNDDSALGMEAINKKEHEIYVEEE